MNKNLKRLNPYPFEKLNSLLGGMKSDSNLPLIAWSVGEPKHPAPSFLIELMKDQDFIRESFGTYPSTKGLPELRRAIGEHLRKRYQLTKELDSDHHILPVTGTREALFSFAQAALTQTDNSVTIMPNPFYQIYEGAALLAGSHPYYLNNDVKTGVPNFDSIPESIWKKCQLFYLCNPGNPSGAVIGTKILTQLIERSDYFDFIIASDECYSEIYTDESRPPPSLLQVSDQIGRYNYKNCIVFNSLSKRSNIPGMRSGFVAGDPKLLERFLLYRTYHGATMPVHHQLLSAEAWQDQSHVLENRKVYQRKLAAVTDILKPVWPLEIPEATFYLWPQTPIDDQLFAQRLITHTNIKVLPGSFLSRETPQGNPGKNRVRLALVSTERECIEAAHRIVQAWPKLISP